MKAGSEQEPAFAICGEGILPLWVVGVPLALQIHLLARDAKTADKDHASFP